ncbi:unnamed protein product [Durusdinium trenchii]|uniref:Uncharacterized protein n=1 Tax=Durusdinium trenchii TaxID=1381693 RepID=A0ABP0R0G5_9DINO
MDGPKLDLSSVQMSAKPDARLIDGNVPPPPAKPDAELIEDTLPMPEFFNWCSLAATPDDDGKRSPRPSFFDTNFLLLGQDVHYIAFEGYSAPLLPWSSTASLRDALRCRNPPFPPASGFTPFR